MYKYHNGENITGHDGLVKQNKTTHKCINTTMVEISLVMMAWSNKTMYKYHNGGNITGHDGLVKQNKTSHKQKNTVNGGNIHQS